MANYRNHINATRLLLLLLPPASCCPAARKSPGPGPHSHIREKSTGTQVREVGAATKKISGSPHAMAVEREKEGNASKCNVKMHKSEGFKDFAGICDFSHSPFIFVHVSLAAAGLPFVFSVVRPLLFWGVTGFTRCLCVSVCPGV